MYGRHADGLLEEGLLGMVEAERLVDDVRLRLNAHRQYGDRLAVLRAEVDVNEARLERVVQSLAGHHLLRLVQCLARARWNLRRSGVKRNKLHMCVMYPCMTA